VQYRARVQIAVATLSVTVSGKLFTPIVPLFIKQHNWQQPSLTVKNRDQLRNSTFGNRVGATFLRDEKQHYAYNFKEQKRLISDFQAKLSQLFSTYRSVITPFPF